MVKLLKRVWHSVLNRWQFLTNFYLLNTKSIRQNRITMKGSAILFRQKSFLTGKGCTEIGERCHFGYKMGGFFRGGAIEIQPRYSNSRIVIGHNVLTNNNMFVCAANYIEIGDNTLIGQNVAIMDHEAHGIEPSKRRQVGEIGQVIIGKNVWIGNDVTILKNTEIGDNTIIAVGAVVSGKFGPNLIIGGVPAKIIKTISA